MPTASLCLLGFVGWTLALVLCIVAVRSARVVTGSATATDFPANRPHAGSERYQRLLRAHLNCLENLPLFASAVLVAQSIGAVLPAWVCLAYLAARVLQSSIHIASGAALAVHARFLCFIVQLGCLAFMLGVQITHGI